MKNFYSLLLFLLSNLAFSQKQQIKFSHILPGNGLSHSFVTSIIQDKKGFMWFGTKDGLNKYDGYTFTIYKNDPDNSRSLTHNFIQDLYLDKEGKLWIASWGGLSKFDPDEEVFTQYKQNKNDPNAIPSDLISSLLEDDYGNLWIGSSEGLILFDRKKNRFTTFRHDKNDPESLGDDYVRDIFMDHQKRLWIGTFRGGLNLFDYKTGKFKRYVHDEKDPSSLGENCVYTLYEDSKHRFWIGTRNNGFDLFDPAKETFTHFRHDPHNPNSLAHNVISCFGEDTEGEIWIGTENGGFSIFNPETKEFKNYHHDDIDNSSLGNNSLYAIYKDVKGNMWLGTYADGVNFLSLEATKFTHYRHNSSSYSLSNNNILCIFEDSENNIWIGTDGGGANLFDRKTQKMTCFRNDPDNPNSIAGDYVLNIREDSAHNIWFGTWGTGVSVYDPIRKKFRNYKNDPADPKSLNCNNAWYIYRSKDNKMWVGTYRGEGLSLYDASTDSFISYSNDKSDSNSLSNNYINYIFEDSKGNFWIGTGGGGLNLFDKRSGKFSAFKRGNKQNSLSSNNVDCIFEDSKGNLWLGTDLGLNLMDTHNKKFTTFSKKDGLPSDVICGILEDKNGYLWISTTNGVSKFSYKDRSFVNYTVAEGLQSQEFKPHAFCKSASGAMYFGGINGFNEFYPDSVTSDDSKSPLLITDFKLFNKSISVGETMNGRVILPKALSETGEIILSHEQSFFSFEFATLNYFSPEKNCYSYMLEGFDKDWNFIGNRRLANYTDVPPGTYIFRVKGSNDSRSKKENETAIRITITPPFWNTWWFKILSVLTVIGTAVGFYTIRMRAIRLQKEALEKQVQERTNDLWIAASEIQTQRDSLKSANEHVMSSINYAKTIQKAILTTWDKIDATVDECFIIYKPKDVVSGDFYWFSHLSRKELNNTFKGESGIITDQNFIAAVDCTGHGVSGAFMSIIGNTLFNEVINQKHILDPATILESVDAAFKKAINISDGVNIAGMDVCLCRIEDAGNDSVRISYGGAKRPLLYVRKGSNTLEKINGDIISIGSEFKENNIFNTHSLVLEKGSMIYLTTDGYIDQNNALNIKMGSARLKSLIEEICWLPLAEQKAIFEKVLSEHQSSSEQRDDITVIGVRV